MVIFIAVHSRNIENIKKYLRKFIGKFDNIYLSSTHDCLTFVTEHTKYIFASVEFLENYHRTALYSNLFYYPLSEQNNDDLMNTIRVNTRIIDCMGFISLPNIFSYDEEKMIKSMEERIGG